MIAVLSPDPPSARRLLELTRTGLAEKLGVDRGTVGDWERGVRLPAEEKIAAVEALLSPGGENPAPTMATSSARTALAEMLPLEFDIRLPFRSIFLAG